MFNVDLIYVLVVESYKINEIDSLLCGMEFKKCMFTKKEYLCRYKYLYIDRNSKG